MTIFRIIVVKVNERKTKSKPYLMRGCVLMGIVLLHYAKDIK